MAKLIYMMNTSLDGYTEDEHGGFGWTTPQDEEVHTWIFAHVSSFRTCLYGRRVYETMLYWETAHTVPDQPQFVLDFCEAVAGSGENRLLEDPGTSRVVCGWIWSWSRSGGSATGRSFCGMRSAASRSEGWNVTR